MQWNGRSFRRITRNEQDVGLVLLWPPTDLVEEAHRIRGVGQGCKPGLMQRRDQESGRDADGLRNVVVLVQPAVRTNTLAFAENADQPRRDLKKRLVRIGAERTQRLEPFPSGAARVKRALFCLSGETYPPLQCTVADHREVPWLLI